MDLWLGKTPWRRERLPTAVFWPGEFYGLCSPWARKESDVTERLSLPGGLPMQETGFSLWVWKIPPKKEMATHPTILPWKIPWTEEPGEYSPVRSQSQTPLSN